MSQTETADTPRGGRRAWSRWFCRSAGCYASWVISAGALTYVLSRLHFTELGKEVTGIAWWLMAAAIVLEILAPGVGGLALGVSTEALEDRLRRTLLQAIYLGTLYSASALLGGRRGSRRRSSRAPV